MELRAVVVSVVVVVVVVVVGRGGSSVRSVGGLGLLANLNFSELSSFNPCSSTPW